VSKDNCYAYVLKGDMLQCWSIKTENLLYKLDRSQIQISVGDLALSQDSRFLYLVSADSSGYRIWSVDHHSWFEKIKFPKYSGKDPQKNTKYLQGWDETKKILITKDNKFLFILTNGWVPESELEHINLSQRESYLPGLGNHSSLLLKDSRHHNSEDNSNMGMAATLRAITISDEQGIKSLDLSSQDNQKQNNAYKPQTTAITTNRENTVFYLSQKTVSYNGGINENTLAQSRLQD
jgi:hypothetical protein